MALMCTNIVLVILICLCDEISGTLKQEPIVSTNLGLIKGLPAPEGNYSMFLGIPYATVDPLNLFGLSNPQTAFNDTFEAFDDSAICPQVEYFSNAITGTLDCLRLNVYVPDAANSNNRLAVLVWFHGGAFSTGFAGRAFHGPKFLVKNNIILVTVNYRLGPYGFFCLDTPEIPGNQGLKDQLIALRWVKDNIAAFGGDNDLITISGVSAGGSSVNHHLIFGKENLFNKVIIQSGPALSPFAMSSSDPNAPLRLAEHIGHESNNLEDALSFLKTVHTDVVIAAVLELGLQFRPCVEKKFDNVVQYISDYPINLEISQDLLSNTPILIGYNDNEALFSHGNVDLEKLENVVYENLKDLFNFDNSYLEQMAKSVRQFYSSGEGSTGYKRQEMIDFISDLRYVHPTHRTIKAYVEKGANSLYHYVFTYDGDRNFFKARSNVTAGGAAHTDELSYLFEIAVLNEPITPEDQLTIDRITTLWSNFAKFSNPTPETTDLIPVQWPQVTKEALNYLDIGSELRVQKRPFFKRMAFWDLFYKVNEMFQQGYRISEKIV